jgi:hypothetical protein
VCPNKLDDCYISEDRLLTGRGVPLLMRCLDPKPWVGNLRIGRVTRPAVIWVAAWCAVLTKTHAEGTSARFGSLIRRVSRRTRIRKPSGNPTLAKPLRRSYAHHSWVPCNCGSNDDYAGGISFSKLAKSLRASP